MVDNSQAILYPNNIQICIIILRWESRNLNNGGVEIYQCEAQSTKTVFDNNMDQYYAGKAMTYAVAYADSLNTSLVSRGRYTHLDFNNNKLLIQKGVENYFAYRV